MAIARALLGWILLGVVSIAAEFGWLDFLFQTLLSAAIIVPLVGKPGRVKTIAGIGFYLLYLVGVCLLVFLFVLANAASR